MASRALVLALSIGAALADSAGLQRLGFLLVLAAVIAAATRALALWWELAEEPDGYRRDLVARSQAALSWIVVLLLVLSAAARSPSLLEPGIPALGSSALAGALALQACQIGLSLAAEARRRLTRRPRVATAR